MGADGDVTLALTGHIGVTLGPAVELPAKFEALLSVLVDVPPTAPEVVDVTVPDAPAVGPPPPPGHRCAEGRPRGAAGGRGRHRQPRPAAAAGRGEDHPDLALRPPGRA